MEALGLDQAKAIQDNSISAPESKAQIVAPLDSEKASPIYPEAQLAVPLGGSGAAAPLRREQRTHCRQLQIVEESLGLQQL